MIVQSSRLLQPLGMLRQMPLRAKMQRMQIQAQWCPGKWMEKQQMSDIECEDFNELHRSRIVHSQMNLLFILRQREIMYERKQLRTNTHFSFSIEIHLARVEGASVTPES